LLVSGAPAKDLLSGQAPESMMPTTTPSPALSGPPSLDHSPVWPASPSSDGVFQVSILRASSFCTSSTFLEAASLLA
jgi:hypothetical protein